ncbi:MAG: S1C family serine protease [Akkermansiaceae bacterium]
MRLILIFVCSLLNLQAQQSLESTFRMSGTAITGVFESQRTLIQKYSAVLYDGRDEVAYGVVISKNGYILTKASEVEGIKGLSARVDRESFKDVEIVATDPLWDVALIKVDAEGLTPVEFAETSDIGQGSWVIVNGASSRSKRRILVGVISANAREIPPSGGAVIGVKLKEEDDQLNIEEVSKGGGAEKGGLKAGDVIISVDGKEVSKIKEMTELLKDKKDGSVAKIKVMREKEELEFEVTLSARNRIFLKKSRNDMMSGDFSLRRSGFPRVLQHDVLANSDTMGGPVLNFDGKVIGMNIARANRAETFAIPVEELRSIVEEMMTKAGE